MTEKAQKLIEGKKIMITGGTGSFGNAAVAALLKSKPEKVIIFSRDEKKQFDMRNKFDHLVNYIFISIIIIMSSIIIILSFEKMRGKKINSAKKNPKLTYEKDTEINENDNKN